MPLCAPRPAGRGTWSCVDEKRDENFVLEERSSSGITSLFGTGGDKANAEGKYRILLLPSMVEIARADTKEDALADWERVQDVLAEEIRAVGSTKFSDHHLLALFEALWEQEHPSADSKVCSFFRAFHVVLFAFCFIRALFVAHSINIKNQLKLGQRVA